MTSEDGLHRLLRLLREPPADLVWDAGAAVYEEDYRPDNNKAFLAAAGKASKHEGDCTNMPSTCFVCEADKVRGLGRAACAAIADYLDQHARTAPEGNLQTNLAGSAPEATGRDHLRGIGKDGQRAMNALAREQEARRSAAKAAPEVSEPSREKQDHAATPRSRSDRKFGQRDGIRYAITWLHNRANEMNDPHARAIINSAAFSLGNEIREGRFPIVRSQDEPTREDLIETLAPFAEFGGNSPWVGTVWESKPKDTPVLHSSKTGDQVTMGDFDRARDVLSRARRG